MIPYLARLLTQHVGQQVQAKTYALEFCAGTREGQAYFEDMRHAYRTIRPFLQKWGCITTEYDVIYRQALYEMQQSNFYTTWDLLTAWGTRPESLS